MGGGAEIEEFLAGGQGVAVEQDLLLSAVARPAADEPMLAAFAKARIVAPRPIRRRRLAVVLLQPGAHFGFQFALQVERRRHYRLGIGVLRFEPRAYVGGQSASVGEHLAPVVSPKPRVIVVPGLPLSGDGVRAALGAWRGTIFSHMICLWPASIRLPAAMTRALRAPKAHPVKREPARSVPAAIPHAVLAAALKANGALPPPPIFQKPRPFGQKQSSPGA